MSEPIPVVVETKDRLFFGYYDRAMTEAEYVSNSVRISAPMMIVGTAYWAILSDGPRTSDDVLAPNLKLDEVRIWNPLAMYAVSEETAAVWESFRSKE